MKTKFFLLSSLLPLLAPVLSAAPVVDVVARFNAADTEFPESIAVDKSGNLYLSMVATGVIKKVTPAGAQSVFATIKDDYIQGLAFDSADNLLVAAGAGVWKVTPAGAVSLYSSIPGDALNDLALAPDGSIYVTYQVDDKSSSVWKIDSKGVAKPWSDSPLLTPVKSIMPFPVGANGLVVDPQNRALYVTVTSPGRLVEIKINADGSAGATRVIAENAALIGVDALRLDDRGNFYTAVNLTNRITKISPDGRLTELASGGVLSFPTSLALDVRSGRTNLYVCNNGDFFFGTTQRDQAVLKLANPDAGRIAQVSTRAPVGTSGDVLLAGFTVDGAAPRTLLIRAVGPTLASFGVTNALLDPRLDIFAAGSATTPTSSNDNWGGDAALTTAATSSGAFPLANATSRDAAVLVTLAPGTYTARVSGVGTATGVALLEIYEVP